ncbi:ABC transporter permease [Acuticoccus kandeliae]|uniref:ABC transporter permease n=1 Tax=Acuticoccus kandeliae TaxID=2073160 RepID=UPI000D3E91D4|nr:ABC transporter permease [Acuticoccus kandeliae]
MSDRPVDAPEARWERIPVKELFLVYPNLVRTASIIVFLILWEIVGRNMDPLFMTYPTAIFSASIELLQTGELQKAFVQSLIPLTIGMVISIVGGMVIGLAMGLSRVVEYAIDPYVNGLNAIPRIALVPLIILWCGLGLTAKVVIVVSVGIFPIIINTFAGVKDVQGTLVDVGRAYSASQRQVLFKIILPAALPFIMAGIRLGFGLGIIGMIVAEFFTAVSGLGGIIIDYGNTFQTAKMFVAIIVIGALGIVLSGAVMMLERRWTGWRQGHGSGE